MFIYLSNSRGSQTPLWKPRVSITHVKDHYRWLWSVKDHIKRTYPINKYVLLQICMLVLLQKGLKPRNLRPSLRFKAAGLSGVWLQRNRQPAIGIPPPCHWHTPPELSPWNTKRRSLRHSALSASYWVCDDTLGGVSRGGDGRAAHGRDDLLVAWSRLRNVPQESKSVLQIKAHPVPPPLPSTT